MTFRVTARDVQTNYVRFTVSPVDGLIPTNNNEPMILLFSGKGTSGFSGWSGKGESGFSGYSGRDGAVAGSNTQFLYNNNSAVGGANVYYTTNASIPTVRIGINQASPAAALLDVNGPVVSSEYNPSANTGTFDCALSNYTRVSWNNATINPSFTNVPASRVVEVIWEIAIGTAVTINWPNSIKWADSGTAPVLTENTTTIFVFITRNGGTTWYGSYLKNYAI
jgi:hypothetical protein